MREILAAPRPRCTYGTDRSSGATIVYDTEGNSRVWPNALNPMRSPCRPDRGKGFHQHRCSSSHASAVEGYRAIREAEEAAAEAVSHGYETELAEYWAAHPRTTFKDYLIGMRERPADGGTKAVPSFVAA